MEKVAQKWINEGGVFYPIDGNTQLHLTPGTGVFQLYKSPSPTDGRIGLTKLADRFDFDFKIYDLGSEGIMETIEKTWNSDFFIENNKNLGVIFNGLKGTGKTISAKLLCNKIGIPVIIVPYALDGMLEFLQSLCFECIILIDEAEKTFKKGEDDEVLLKLIDGVYNRSRKLYILTTNRLEVNENLLGRPGRIRYVKEFGNLSSKAVCDYIDDNLKFPDQKENIIQTVDLLEISTIDILRSIVEEVNIHGQINEESCLNIPRAKYIFDVLMFPEQSEKEELEIREYLRKAGSNFFEWWKSPIEGAIPDDDGDLDSNEDYVYNKWKGDLNKVTSQFSSIWKGAITSYGDVLEEPDADGYFKVRNTSYWGETVQFCKLIQRRNRPSLYHGELAV